MRELLERASERAINYLKNLPERRVFPDAQAIERLHELDIAFPEKGFDPQTILTTLDEIGSPATVASAGGRYFGFVIGGSLPVSLAAQWLAGAWDQNGAMIAASPIGAKLEEVSRHCICRMKPVSVSSPGRRWQISPRSQRLATPCWCARAGTSKREAYSERQKSRSSSAKKFTSPCLKR